MTDKNVTVVADVTYRMTLYVTSSIEDALEEIGITSYPSYALKKSKLKSYTIISSDHRDKEVM